MSRPPQRPARPPRSHDPHTTADRLRPSHTRTSPRRPALPEGRRRPSGGRPPAGRPRRLPGRLTGRAAILLAVVCALALTLVYPVRQYIAQTSQLHQLRRQTAEEQQAVQRLQQEQQAWNDPAYVRAQARARLHYVDPGETPYAIASPSAAPDASDRGVPAALRQPWYVQLWNAVTTPSLDVPAALPTAPVPTAPPSPTPRVSIGPQPTPTATAAAHHRAH